MVSRLQHGAGGAREYPPPGVDFHFDRVSLDSIYRSRTNPCQHGRDSGRDATRAQSGSCSDPVQAIFENVSAQSGSGIVN
jgi:hypothetical protein